MTDFAIAAVIPPRILTGFYRTGNPPQLALVDRTAGRDPCLAPSGWVYFVTGGIDQSLARLHVSGTAVEKIPGMPFLRDCALSFDGQSLLAMTSDCHWRDQLISIALDTFEVTPLTGPIKHSDPAPGPDGVVLVSYSRTGPGLFVLRRDGNLERITNGLDCQPAFSPDGRFLTFLREHAPLDWEICRLDWPPLGAPSSLRRIGWRIQSPTVTPDGSNILFFDTEMTNIMPASGGDFCPLPYPIAAISLARDVELRVPPLIGVEETDDGINIGGLHLPAPEDPLS